MYAKFLAAVFALGTPLVSMASTSVIIDAKAHCLSHSFGGVSGGAPLTFQVPPGRYVFSLVNNTMSCSSGDLSGGCHMDTVFLQGGWGSARWGAVVTSTPTVIDMTRATMSMSAYVGDDGCYNNTGTAEIKMEPTT